MVSNDRDSQGGKFDPLYKGARAARATLWGRLNKCARPIIPIIITIIIRVIRIARPGLIKGV